MAAIPVDCRDGLDDSAAEHLKAGDAVELTGRVISLRDASAALLRELGHEVAPMKAPAIDGSALGEASSASGDPPPQADAVNRMKLYKLAWDMTGSEFAGRHLQYEKFYAGASFIIRNHSYRETPWGDFNALVDKCMAGYDVPDKDKSQAAE